MIDIIIPAYNAHQTIKQTLLSICMQTIFPLVKVYIIDDVSDKPYDYLLDLFKGRLEISIIRNKENCGPGICRNIGIDSSFGEYILFLDSDDLLVDCYSLENLFNSIEKDNSDIAIGAVGVEDEKGEVTYITNHINCLHAKLYRRSYIEDNKLRFNDSRNHEDNSFHNLFMVGLPKKTIIDNKIYFYRYNKNSITNKDPKYAYKSLIQLAKNCIWLSIEAEKRKYNKVYIAAYLLTNISYIYHVHMNYLDEPDLQDMYKSLAPLLLLYLSYDKFLTEEDKYACFYSSINNYHHIPTMTFFEFIDCILKKDS